MPPEENNNIEGKTVNGGRRGENTKDNNEKDMIFITPFVVYFISV